MCKVSEQEALLAALEAAERERDEAQGEGRRLREAEDLLYELWDEVWEQKELIISADLEGRISVYRAESAALAPRDAAGGK